MNRLRMLAAVASVGLALALAAPWALAQGPRITQTDCDTLSTSPPLVRVTFAVINTGTVPVCTFTLDPIQSGPTPADSCRILACSSPPGWKCGPLATGGAVWTALDGACIGEGQKHEPFDIELDPLFCCYRVQYFDPSGAVFFVDTICFECEKPVATQTGSWGSLKALYR